MNNKRSRIIETPAMLPTTLPAMTPGGVVELEPELVPPPATAVLVAELLGAVPVPPPMPPAPVDVAPADEELCELKDEENIVDELSNEEELGAMRDVSEDEEEEEHVVDMLELENVGPKLLELDITTTRVSTKARRWRIGDSAYRSLY